MVNPDSLNRQARCFLQKPAKAESETGYKGVTRKENGRYFVAGWNFGKTKKSLGGYDCVIEAAKAYDTYIRKTVGDWAYCNFHTNGKRRMK